MTISTVISDVTQDGDGSNRSWTWNFLIPDDESLQIIVTDVDGTETVVSTNFTVTGIGLETGGTLTYPTVASGLDPLTDTDKLTINRIVANTQPRKIRNQRRYDPQVVEDALDRLTMQVQQNSNGLARSVQIPISSSESPENYIATITALKNEASASALAASNSADAMAADAIATAADRVQTGLDADATAADAIATAADVVTATTQAGIATTKANEASASAAAAAASAAEGLYNNVVTLTNADSPYVPAAAEEGTLYRLDMTSGAIVLNLSALSVYGEDMKFGFVKVDASGNAATINRGGTDTISGNTSITLSTKYETHVIVGDSATGTWIDTVQTTGIADNSVTNAKLAQMPTLTIKGNDTGGTANTKDLTVAEVLAMLSVYTQAQVDSAIAAIGTGAKTLIRTITLSNQADAVFDASDLTGYDRYKIEFQNVLPVTDGAYLYLVGSVNDGSTYIGSPYQVQGSRVQSSTLANYFTGSEAFARLTSNGIGVGGTSEGGATGTLDLGNWTSGGVNYKYAHIVSMFTKSDGNTEKLDGQIGIYGAGAAAGNVNNIKIYCSTGNLNTGKIKLYGIS